MNIRPVQFLWTDDGVMKPLDRFKRRCDQQYVVGEIYALAPTEEVSQHDRGGLFAAVRKAWENLDHEFDGKFPSIEHLRKWALIEVGYQTQAEYALANEEDAMQLAIAVRKADDYARIARSGSLVVVRTAKSIAAHAIKSAEFKVLKRKVLDLVGSL